MSIIISKELWTIVCGEVGCVWQSTVHLSDAHLYWDNSVQILLGTKDDFYVDLYLFAQFYHKSTGPLSVAKLGVYGKVPFT